MVFEGPLAYGRADVAILKIVLDKQTMCNNNDYAPHAYNNIQL